MVQQQTNNEKAKKKSRIRLHQSFLFRGIILAILIETLAGVCLIIPLNISTMKVLPVLPMIMMMLMLQQPSENGKTICESESQATIAT